MTANGFGRSFWGDKCSEVRWVIVAQLSVYQKPLGEASEWMNE